MMLAISSHTRIFVFSEATDMRKSFHGLSGLVAEHFEVDLLSGHLFLFFNRRRDCIKILAWEHDGLQIWYKRLESGTYQMLSPSNGSMEIDSVQLSMLLSGIDLNSAKRRKRYQAA
jgi:transposase